MLILCFTVLKVDLFSVPEPLSSLQRRMFDIFNSYKVSLVNKKCIWFSSFEIWLVLCVLVGIYRFMCVFFSGSILRGKNCCKWGGFETSLLSACFESRIEVIPLNPYLSSYSSDPFRTHIYLLICIHVAYAYVFYGKYYTYMYFLCILERERSCNSTMRSPRLLA